VPRAVYKTEDSQEFRGFLANWADGCRRVALRAGMVLTSVDRPVGVADLDGNATSKLFAVGARPNTCNCLNERGLPMVNVPRSADVDFRLSREFWQLSLLPPSLEQR